MNHDAGPICRMLESQRFGAAQSALTHPMFLISRCPGETADNSTRQEGCLGWLRVSGDLESTARSPTHRYLDEVQLVELSFPPPG